MSQSHLTPLRCGECKHLNYWTRKNRKRVERKLELAKFCSWCKKKVAHKESKK